ncbi:O-antigen ligase family protein [Colwellia piezophila]|uniref:O-antigen ligase family protein n=1 Tax=Colwellia piezophila TaxID=211668 RepID=UPI00036DC2CC|nr:O-antigen ligase family protein [Colwellia piezophila]
MPNLLTKCLFWAILTIILNYMSYGQTAILSIICLCIGQILLLYKTSWGILFYIATVVIFSDIAFDFGDEELSGLSTIYTVSVGPFSLSVFWTLSLALIVGFKYTQAYGVSKNLLLVIFVFIFYFVLGIYNIGLEGSRFVSDVAYFVNILTGYIITSYLFNSVYSNGRSLHDDLVILISIFSAKCLFLILHAIEISNTLNSYSYFAESGLYLSCFFIPLVLAMMNEGNNSKYFKIALFLPITANLISASRGRLIIIVFAACFALIRLGKIQRIIYFIPICFIAGSLVYNFSAAYFDFFLWKLDTFEIGNDKSQSSTVRYIEFLNILYLHIENIYSFFIGTGFGSYFTSENVAYPFSLYGTDAYPNIWITNDTFFKPHSSLLYIFLKFGLIGFVICFIYLPYVAYKNSIHSETVTLKGYYPLMIAISSSLFLLFLVNFSSKLQIFTGLLLGALFSLRKLKLA